jgi:signal transduction histidine kinase
MKMRFLGIIYTIVMLVMFKVLLGSFGQDDFSKRDMVYYNDIIEQINDAYNSGMSVDDIKKQYNCDILLRDDSDYMSKLYGYYANYGLVVDFEPDEVIGKICFVAEENAFSDAKGNVRRNIIYIWVALFVSGYVFMFVLYYNYIRPFKELKHFSGEVAKGNLDVLLPMHRANLFGAFTESFDLMREELSKSRKREAEAEKSKKELVAQLSHDIKTPVATIKATCEVLEMQEKMKADASDATLEKIGYISNKADTIDSLISNMFQATLEELEVLEVKPVETDSRIISGFFDELSSYGNIVVDNELPECLVYMDKLRMEQVIGNVIGNSAKYAGTDINVSYKLCEEVAVNGAGIASGLHNAKDANTIGKNNFLKITVRDYGPGIPDEDIYNVTEKFYRGKNAVGKQGSGLGLYLAKFFMEKQLGGCECYNDNGFVVELYLKKV